MVEGDGGFVGDHCAQCGVGARLDAERDAPFAAMRRVVGRQEAREWVGGQLPCQWVERAERPRHDARGVCDLRRDVHVPRLGHARAIVGHRDTRRVGADLRDGDERVAEGDFAHAERRHIQIRVEPVHDDNLLRGRGGGYHVLEEDGVAQLVAHTHATRCARAEGTDFFVGVNGGVGLTVFTINWRIGIRKLRWHFPTTENATRLTIGSSKCNSPLIAPSLMSAFFTPL